MKILSKLSGARLMLILNLLSLTVWLVPGQVYETNEDLKKGLINAYKEFLEEYKAVGGKIVQFDDCLWELFDPSKPCKFLCGS